MEVKTISTQHLDFVSARPFADVAKRFEEQLGRLDSSVFDLINEDPPRVEEFRKAVEKAAGPTGYMIFETREIGRLLRIADQKRHATQYAIGNPLKALRMIQHKPQVALYVPVRMIIFEDDQGRTHLEYDKPSATLAIWNDEKVLKTARELDADFEQLARNATT